MSQMTPMTHSTVRSGRAGRMRAEFDAGFLERPQPVVLDLEDVLALRVGPDERMIALGEVAGVIAQPLLTVLPTTQPAMLGVVSDRGSVLAAYDLGTLLGLAPEKPRWLLIPAAGSGVAITFENFGGFRRLDPATLGHDLMLPLSDVLDIIRGLAADTGSEI